MNVSAIAAASAAAPSPVRAISPIERAGRVNSRAKGAKTSGAIDVEGGQAPTAAATPPAAAASSKTLAMLTKIKLGG